MQAYFRESYASGLMKYMNGISRRSQYTLASRKNIVDLFSYMDLYMMYLGT